MCRITRVLGLAVAVLPAVAAVRQGNDARPLLREIADASRVAGAWRAEGTVQVTITSDGKPVASGAEAFDFVSILKRTGQARLENASAKTVDVCDGVNRWFYFLPELHYSRQAAHGWTGCVFEGVSSTVWPYPTWANLTDGLDTAYFTGKDTVEYQDDKASCDVIQAEYAKMPVRLSVPNNFVVPSDERAARSLCVDRGRHLILRDRVTARLRRNPLDRAVVEVTVTTTFRNVEENPIVSAHLFRFQPVAGAQDLGSTMPVAAQARRTRAPQPALRREPEYTEDARKAHLEGTVTVALDVSADGVPQNVRVIQPLDPGLDRNAVAAVSAWRFLPALKAGTPVSAPTTVEVNFRIGEKTSAMALPSVELPKLTAETYAGTLVRLPGIEGPARPSPYTSREVLSSGYVTLLFLGSQAVLNRFDVGDPFDKVDAFLRNGERYDRGGALNVLCGGPLPPGTRAVEWKDARYVVNDEIDLRRPPEPRALVLLFDGENRMRAILR